jgi:DNA-binding MurR/RpiR family transcriptional regulator
MATWNRKQIGKIVKKSDDKLRFEGVKEFSLKIEQDITLKAGTYLNLENKAFKLASLEANRDKMSPENYEKAVERINKMPDYVFFEVIKLDKEG